MMTEQERMALDAEIAAKWPQEWAKANHSRPGASKRRNNLRKRYRYVMELEAFVRENPTAKCANCRHMSTVNYSKPYCELDSDFHGYQTVALDYVCVRWTHSI